ncbi:hypothetical protein [Sphingobacterium sp.]|uniref:hypothetical protein n=1 Tax=Sphingobacterium sp. TaxID=341027 RepID=UPI0031DB6495
MDVTDKLTLNLAKCKTDYAVAVAQILTKTAQQNTAKNALIQATKEFRNELVNSLQLIDAEHDYEEGLLDSINRIYMQRRAAVALLSATGKLSLSAIND